MDKTFEVEVLFNDPDEAEAMIAAVTALVHKVECNSTVFVPSCAPTKQAGDADWISYSIEIGRAAA